jgi:hypothetical protein
MNTLQNVAAIFASYRNDSFQAKNVIAPLSDQFSETLLEALLVKSPVEEERDRSHRGIMLMAAGLADEWWAMRSVIAGFVANMIVFIKKMRIDDPGGLR